MFSSSRLFENSANSESAKRREAAPRSVAAVQQIVATVIGGYVNHPDVNRTWTIDAIKFVTQPMCKRQNLGAPPSLQGLSAHGRYQRSLRAVEVLRDKLGDQTRDSTSAPTGRSLGRSDPHLLRSNFRQLSTLQHSPLIPGYGVKPSYSNLPAADSQSRTHARSCSAGISGQGTDIWALA